MVSSNNKHLSESAEGMTQYVNLASVYISWRESSEYSLYTCTGRNYHTQEGIIFSSVERVY